MIRLSMLKESDFEMILSWNAGESEEYLKLWAGNWFDYPLTKEQLVNYYKENSVNNVNSSTFIYKIINTEQIVGIVELGKLDRQQKRATLGKMLIGDRDEWGKGYGKGAVQVLLKIAKEDHKLETIFLRVFEFNERAINLYRSAGFKVIGESSKKYPIKGKYWKVIEMEITLQGEY